MEKKHIYTTVNGLEVEYKAISLDALRLSKRGIERQYRERGEPLDPPVYKWKTASGAEISDPHDATTPKSEEEQAAWDAFIDATNRLNYEYNAVLMRYVLDDALIQIALPEDTTWQEKHKARYIEIPTKLQELRDFYITAEVLPTKPDMNGLVASVLLLSEQGKVDPDALEARLDLFRGRVRRKAAKRIDRTEKPLEAQPETNGD